MKQEIKDKLRNAGFEGIEFMKKSTTAIDIEVKVSEVDCFKLHVSVSIMGEVITSCLFDTLEQLNKICYGFLLEDLNFEGKSYKWEDCILKGEEGFYISGIKPEIWHTYIKEYATGLKNVFTTKSAAISGGLAHPQLSHIVAEINKDYEADSAKYYIVFCSYNGFEVKESKEKLNPFMLNSEAAALKLIETNTPLLNQYFETNT